MSTSLKIEGMSCQNCARHVREALLSVAGVKSVQVNLEGGSAVVNWLSSPTTEPLLHALQGAGYPGKVLDAPAPIQNDFAWWLNVGLAGGVTLFLAIGEAAGWMMLPWFDWLSFFLALPVQVLAGGRFYQGAWRQLLVGQSNMDTLVALGSSAAFLYSCYELFYPPHHSYFMESCGIIALISLGHGLEARASRSAGQAVEKLLNLAPAQAHRVKPDGTGEEEVSVADLLPGDRIILRPGDQIPVDGTVLEGSGAVDESMLTGESMAVEKRSGSPIYTGTLNQNGRLICTVSSTGEQTALAKIAALVDRAQNSRAEVQRLVDRISSLFVPVVVGIALVAFVGWGLLRDRWDSGLVQAVSVLIVACPCAMGLATPTAIMAGTNVAARRGILIRDGQALEKSGRIQAVLFDKTGTLTEGRPRVIAHGSESAESHPLARALSSPSRHPYSKAIFAYCQARSPSAVPTLDQWQEEPGKGVSAKLGGMIVRLGSLPWLAECGVKVPVAGEIAEIGLSKGYDLIARFILQDSLKPEARSVIDQLRQAKLDLYLVSGDQRSVAQAVGRQLGLAADHVFAGVLPGGKAEVIQGLQAKGLRVAFVGDGINDGPALALADLGIAVSQASDVAKESADILLLRADLRAVPEALLLSQKTLRTIWQNLFWAFFYNIIAIPLAAFGYASPLLCAIAMGLSDLCVIGNSLRLLRSR